MTDLTPVLRAAEARDPQGAAQLLPLMYEELRRSAAQKLAHQPAGQTLQPTALVHEAFLKLLANPARTWESRRHFFAAASETMRHILVDRARSKAAVRHGGALLRVDLADINLAADSAGESVLALSDALERLAAHDAEAAELVRLRFFGGFTFAQAAELLGVSERTAKRTWAYARAWLYEHLRAGGCPAA
ncbi:MAG: sigma-70 family RNA polymerase sigma factor [Opitutae bacterium]|nr:sigma-70 family RNA polymerase sigma factor [Opitutae bacterium]